MATNIILKKSSITGRVPNDSALAYGELALNYTDGKLYYKHSSQTVRTFLDENQIITLIDSDYVAARSPAGGGGSGTDSAQVIGIIEDTIDSNYIVARLGTVGSPLVVFNYEADSGQSTFTGSDVNGQTLSYQAEDLLVFINGILLVDSDDYTASNGSSIELFVPADSGDVVTIAAFNIRLSDGLDSADVTTLIDSDYINSRVTATAGTDSAQVISLITDTVDSAYIQARQVDIYRDSAFITNIIDSDHVRSKQDYSYNSLIDLPTDLVTLADSQTLTNKTIDGAIFANTFTIGSQIFYEQGNNGFSVNEDFDPSNNSLQTAYHFTSGAGRSELAFTLARTGQFTNGFGIYGTAADNKFVLFGEQSNTGWEWRTGVGIRPLDLDGGTLRMALSKVGNLTLNDAFTLPNADGASGQVLTTDGVGNVTFQSVLDSSNIISIVTDTVDSAYVAARTPAVDFTGYATESYVTTQINNLVDGAPDALNTLNELAAALNDDSDAYNSLLSLIGGKLDSAGVTNLIDSAYVQARVTIDAGTDSATVIGLITDTVDSAYIGNRVSIDSDVLLSALGVGKSPLVTYQFTADSGQLTFTGLDDNSNTLTYTETENLLVFINGVLLATDDYTATNGTSIVLDIAADSADTVTIARFNILDAIQSVSPIDKFVYTADSGQTVFTGADDNSNTLNYSQEKLLVYLNGILLVDSADYTATSGNSVVLTSPSAVDDVVTVTTFNLARGAGLDSAAVTNLVDSAYIAARVTVGGGTDSATVVSLISDTVDSAYIQARQVDIYRDSAFVTSIIDSDYINARVTATAGTDSAQVVSLITDTVDSAYIQARQITYTVLDSADVSAIISATDFVDSADVSAIISAIDFVDSTDVANIVEAYGYLTTAIDSAAVISLIDSDYVAARTSAGTDSATVISLITNTVDSSYILSTIGTIGSPLVVYHFEADSGQTEFTGADLQGNTLSYVNGEDILVYLNGVLLVDSDDYFATNGSSVNLYTAADSGNTLTIAQFNIILSDGLDSTDVISFIDSDYISARFPTGGSSTVILPFAFAFVNTTSNSSGTGISWSNWNSANSTLDFTFDVAQPNSNYAVVTESETFDDYFVGISNKTTTGFRAEFYDNSGSRTPSSFSPFTFLVYGSNPQQRIAGLVGDYLDSSTANALIGSTVDSAYVQARQITYTVLDSTNVAGIVEAYGYLTTAIDSAAIINLIDSDYIAARSAPGTDSATVVSIVTDTVDSAYIQARQVDIYRDSAFITNIVDSDYINARVTATAGTDSATVISLVTDTIDSAYIAFRVDSDLILSALGTASSPIVTYTFEADSGQTVFSGNDVNGRSFTYSPNEDLLVYINGILLLDSTDYTASNGTSLSLNVPADSADLLTIARFNLLNTLNVVSPIDLYVYTADSGQTAFSGVDDNGNTFSYSNENLLVYLNGILLVDSADFNATSGTTVTLTSPTAVDDVLSIATFNMTRGSGLDSATLIGLIDSDYIQARQTGGAEWIEQSGNYTANANENIFVATASASITITLPASPVLGDQVRIVDATGNAGTHNIIINGNSNKIMGQDSDLTIDVDGAAFGLAYYNATRGWVFTEK